MKISGEEGKAATREAGKEWERGGWEYPLINGAEGCKIHQVIRVFM